MFWVQVWKNHIPYILTNESTNEKNIQIRFKMQSLKYAFRKYGKPKKKKKCLPKVWQVHFVDVQKNIDSGLQSIFMDR